MSWKSRVLLPSSTHASYCREQTVNERAVIEQAVIKQMTEEIWNCW